MEDLRKTNTSYSCYKMYMFVREFFKYISVQQAKKIEENIWGFNILLTTNHFDIF